MISNLCIKIRFSKPALLERKNPLSKGFFNFMDIRKQQTVAIYDYSFSNSVLLVYEPLLYYNELKGGACCGNKEYYF